MQLKYFSAVLLALISLLVSPFVLAHSGGGHVAGLSDGFMHPVTGLDHLLIAIAAGFWAARSGDHGVPDVVYFLSMLLGGMLLGICCIQFPELSIAAPRYFAYIFFGGFAIYHGMVHMLEMPTPAVATGYMVGLFIATGLMCMLGLILRQVVITRKPHSHKTH